MEDLNDGIEWVFRYCDRYLNKAKNPLPPRDNAVEFHVRTDTKELNNNLKLHICSSDLREKVKEVATY